MIMDNLEEASMNFDGDMVRSFLERLNGLLAAGFGPTQVDQVVQLAEELDVDEECELDFEVEYNRQPMPLKVRVFKDDVDAPDLYFFAPPELSRRIRDEMKRFSDQLGI